MGKAIAIAVGGGVISAFIVLIMPALGWAGALVFSTLAPLPLLLIGLSLGVPGAAIATATSALLLALANEGWTPAVTLILTYGLPTVLISRQALLNRPGDSGRLEWYPPGLLLLWIIGYGLAGIAAAVALTLGEPGGLPGAIASDLEALLDGMPPDVAAAIRQVGVEQIARSLPGAAVMIWSLQMLINLWLAQGLLTRSRKAIRPSLDIVDIELPTWPAIALAATGVTAAVAPGIIGFLALNVALGLGICFFIAGLAVIHAVMRNKPFKPLALTAVYLSLLLSWPALLITGLGVIEQWAGFRRRALARNRED